MEQVGGGRRADCTEISREALKNAVEVLTNSPIEFHSIIVCTYPSVFPKDGRIVKAHHKSLQQALKYRYEEASYFTAVEYQKRGAVHLHIAVNLNLSEYGQVSRLKRNKSSRRQPVFETVKAEQDWLFETWLDIIRKPDPAYDGEPLDWAGLSGADEAKMREAYYKHNAAISWEVMREKGKAANYMVKELRGLKDYQKQVPQGYENPGRHFLYSRDVKFPESDVIEFVLTEVELKSILEEIDWKYRPEGDKSLYKRLWNTAAQVAIKLIERGLQPIQGGLKALQRYTDQRMVAFADMTDELTQKAAGAGILGYAKETAAYWQTIKQGYERQQYWERVFSTGPP